MNINLSAQIKRLEAQRHRRAKIWCRLRSGVMELVKRPWKLIFPMLFLPLFLFAWNKRTKIPLPGGSSTPLLAGIWLLAITLLTVILAVLLLFGLLVTIGTPRRAREIEACLLHVALVDRYGFGPILVYNRGIRHTDITSMAFLSRGISMEAWEKKQTDIEDRLNVHLVEGLKYGGKRGTNRNYIILTVAPGIGARRAEPLYDDEL